MRHLATWRGVRRQSRSSRDSAGFVSLAKVTIGLKLVCFLGGAMGIHQEPSLTAIIQPVISRLRTSQGRGLRALIPDIGWALAALLFILVVLRDAVRDLLKKLAAATISSIMQ